MNTHKQKHIDIISSQKNSHFHQNKNQPKPPRPAKKRNTAEISDASDKLSSGNEQPLPLQSAASWPVIGNSKINSSYLYTLSE